MRYRQMRRKARACAVAKGNKTLHDALNQALSKVMADGTYAKLSAQWFGQDIRCK